MADLSTATPNLPPSAAPQAGVARRVSRNVAVSLARVSINAVVALVLPAYLTHRLPVATYGAWVLILQLSAYVSFLDIGVQVGVAKFVAEYDARGDQTGAGERASAGLVIMCAAALLGVLLTSAVAWQVPRLFANMPAAFLPGVRLSVLLIGISLSFGLVCSVFSAVFLGLQRYAVPMVISIANRSLFTLVVCVAVFLHGSLAAMGAAAALVNVATGLLQVAAWRAWARRIHLSLTLVTACVLRQVLGYCSVLAVWSAAMVCISGLDVTIVGHYDFGQTGYYSLATMPTSLLIVIVSSSIAPLMPAASALSTQRTAAAMGNILSRTTRYATVLLLVTGLPLLVGAYPILRLWVGPVYAAHSMWYLQILLVANIIRNLCLPYSTMVMATGKQKFATAAAIAEAIVNLASSIYLARSIGAAGVAAGTILGALVSVCMHFAVSMRYTHSAMSISRARLFFAGMLRPALIAAPTAVLAPYWWKARTQPLSPLQWIAWAMATLLLAWFAGLNREERRALQRTAAARLRLPA